MTTPRGIEATARDLGTWCRGEVTVAVDELAKYSRDFGGIVRRTPAIVFRPSSVSDVATALTIAREHDLVVTARGSGHSQSGQCLGEQLILDMRGLNRVLRVSAADGAVEVEAGATWRAVVDATFEHGLLPKGLTHVLDTTVAGTLSVGGVGAESWSSGPQVDNVAFLDVVTLDGGVVRTSVSENRELFDGVRAGFGQCGVIVRAVYPLRPCRARVRSRYFVYRSAERFIRDVDAACVNPTASFVSGVFARDARDMKAWVLLLVLGFEHDGAVDATDESWVKNLSFEEELPLQDAPLWNASGVPGHLFFRLHAPRPGTIDADPATLHPWVDHVFPPDSIRQMLDELLGGRWPVLLLGTAALIFIRRGSNAAPLFRVPAGALGWGVGIFPSVSPEFGDAAVTLMSEYSRRGRDLGGLRYLSGYIDFEDQATWKDHYGPAWDSFKAAKLRFDPTDRLNPGFIRWG